MYNIMIRTDSSFTIGTGHIMRDLVLAQQFSKSNISFATLNLDGNINYKITDAGYKLNDLINNSIDEIIKLIKKEKIDLIVIDHYDIDYTFEKELKIIFPLLRIMVIDDTYEKHYSDILLNHNIYANKKKYKGKVPQHCELRCGSKYTLLREEFIIEKKKKYSKNQFKNKILVSLGGTDNYNLNIKILNLLKSKSNISVDLVTTTANCNIIILKQFCKNKKWITLHINTNKMAQLMNTNNLAIVTPSVIVNEAYFMEIPFIAIKVSKNQNEMFLFLKKNKFKTLDKSKLFKLKELI